MSNFTLSLFASQSPCSASAKNTSFSTEPTILSPDNARAFFRCDHTPIKLTDGYRRDDNFEYATAIPGDCDNSHSDNPDDWVSIEDVSSKLKEKGINHWIVSSRNHLRPKFVKEKVEKDGETVEEMVEKARRPKFHVYFPLSVPLADKEKYRSYCKWFIRKFNGDPQVKSCSQQIFGYGNHSAPVIIAWEEGHCIGEMLTEGDLAAVEKPSSPPAPPEAGKATPSEQTKKPDSWFKKFKESGEWRNRLGDLETKGWVFFEKNETLFFQTPDGDHTPGAHDGNITKNGVAYIFSKAPTPFENQKGYSICQLFAGVLFGDTGKIGLRKLVEHYAPTPNSLSKPTVRNPALVSLLKRTAAIDYRRIAGVKEGEKISQKIYHVITVSQIIKNAKENDWGLAVSNGFVYLFNGSFWNSLDIGEFRTFLAAAATRLGVPELDARHHSFREELFKQFVSDGNLPVPTESERTLINLMNGTFEISETTQELREPRPDDFLKHQLPFEFDAAATAPAFQKFLDRVLPEPELQTILAEYIAYIFVFGLKLEKVLILYGSGANGKSVFFEVILALLGRDNVSSYSLSSLTASNSYQRAELQNKLLNYASEINGKLEADTFKQLASGEPVECRRIYGNPFMLYRYARLMFNANELPSEVENTNAFFRRFIIVPFRVTIPEDEQDPELARKIIASELPGVFNWVLTGLKRLLQNRKFTESHIVRKQIEEYKRESDSVATFFDDTGYRPSRTIAIAVKVFYDDYKGFCQDDGYRAVSKRKFTKRCRDAGFVIEKNRGYVIYAEK